MKGSLYEIGKGVFQLHGPSVEIKAKVGSVILVYELEHSISHSRNPVLGPLNQIMEKLPVP